VLEGDGGDDPDVVVVLDEQDRAGPGHDTIAFVGSDSSGVELKG
jgi:hypothetical protein